MIRVSDPGDVDWMTPDQLVEGDAFRAENQQVAARGGRQARGVATPTRFFCPAPHEVARALVTGFTTPPARPDEPWLHQALLHSIGIIFWGFLISSLVGVPLGILCGALPAMSRLTEPFIEFFRYLPAPAFGALAVAVLGINDAPKIAIIFIGTFFQQVLVVANTTRRLDPALLEAAQTLGAKPRQLLLRVVVPGIVTDLYTDMRVLLGWAWTYLIVAELIGVSSGHHLLHQPAGQVPRLRPGLRVDHPDRPHRPVHRRDPGVDRAAAVPLDAHVARRVAVAGDEAPHARRRPARGGRRGGGGGSDGGSPAEEPAIHAGEVVS